MQEGSFSHVIADHLELQRRNSRLERTLPIDRYRDQFDRGSEAVEQPDVDDARSEPVQTPWDDPDSWWNVSDEPTFNWSK